MDKQFPKIVVGCFILNEKREILLVHSYKWPGRWVVMGGHIEWGEPIALTCERESMEEVGLKVKFVRVIEVAEFIFDPNFHNQKHFIALQCECELLGEPIPKIDNKEIQVAQWFRLQDAVDLPNILPITLQTIKKLMNSID
jgi:NAD+ diphosphatase